MSAARNADAWNAILVQLRVKPFTSAKWAALFAQEIGPSTFSAGDSEIDAFMGQILHESAYLEKLEEGLNYRTPGRLMAVWPTRFKSLADEVPYLSNPEALANKVYSGRMGNINVGDGWRYRGSGLIQVTGADNFRELQRLTGVPVYDQPELLRRPTASALKVAIAWWEGAIPDQYLGDVRKITKRVNGGLNGLNDRIALTDQASQALSSGSSIAPG